MIRVSVKTDFARMDRLLTDRMLKQLPFATAAALTDTAIAAKLGVTKALPEIFGKDGPPTAFTLNAIAIRSATKSNLQSVVYLRPIQAKYLFHEEVGGTRTAAENTRKPASALVLPGKIKLDSHGNIPAGVLARLMKARGKKGVFYAKGNGPLGGPGGLFQRLPGGHLKRLTAFESATHYTPRFHYRARVQSIARATFAPALKRRLLEAMRTAHP